MASEPRAGLAMRFFRACLLIFGAVILLWLALELLAQIWGWLILIALIVITVYAAITWYRMWRERR